METATSRLASFVFQTSTMNYELKRKQMKPVQGLRQKASTEILVNNAWLCAYASLWKTAAFSEKEIAKTKALINTCLTAVGDPEKAYGIFCQRVLLTQEYLHRHPNAFVPLPSRWLDRNNLNGFAGTKKWMERLLEQRAALPQFKIELKAFGEALLELSAEPSISNFLYWKNYFISYPELLNLFLNTVALQQFQNN
jgi:hypothetical protein